MVCVDDVRAGDGPAEPEGEGVGGMAAEACERAQHAEAKAARLAPGSRFPPEGDELAVDTPGERATELERIPLAAPEDPGSAEGSWSDVDDPHLVLPLVTLGDPRRLSGGYLYHVRMAEAAPAHGARIVFVSFPERPYPLAALRGRAVLRRASEHAPSALLLDSIAAAFAAPALATRRLAVPLVAVLHQPPGGIDHGRARTRAQAPLDRLALRRAALVIAASDHLAEQLAVGGVPSSRIRVVPPGRDVAPLPPGPLPDLRGGRRAAFLTVANWLPRKGVLEVLHAFARLPAAAGTLHLAGDEAADPRYARSVRARLAEGDLAGRVVRHGAVSREEVARLFEAADVFVLPASREPYGTVWGEATAVGLPVVGWHAGNLPYLVEDGREGLLARPGDVDALSQAMSRLAFDPELRGRLGAAAKRRAVARPTWEAVAGLFFGAVREGLELSRGRR